MSFFKRKTVIIILVVIIGLILLSGDKKKENSVSTNTDTSSTYTSKPSPQLSKNTPQTRGSRLLGMGLSEGNVGFEKTVALAKDAGVQVTELGIAWDDTEKEPRVYDTGWLPIINQYYSKSDIKLGIVFNLIDTNNTRLPRDLRDKAFNDPELIERYKSFVDFVAEQLPGVNIVYISIGNEVDGYLGNSDAKWQAYTDFFNTVAPYVKTKFPHAVIGSKVTYSGGIMDQSDKVKILNKNTDGVLVTYYPFKKGGFTAADPSGVQEDFKRIVSMYPNKKIYFAEIGYPSGSLNGSSEGKQADFIKEAFVAWDTYTNNIPLLNFQWIHDASPETVSQWESYYGLKDKSFASFLGSIGLRTYDGKDKQSFIVLNQETQKRGW